MLSRNIIHTITYYNTYYNIIRSSLTWTFTCKVVRCLSLNLFSTYLSTKEVFPTAPSPKSTTLNEWLFGPLELEVAIIQTVWIIYNNWRFVKLQLNPYIKTEKIYKSKKIKVVSTVNMASWSFLRHCHMRKCKNSLLNAPYINNKMYEYVKTATYMLKDYKNLASIAKGWVIYEKVVGLTKKWKQSYANAIFFCNVGGGKCWRHHSVKKNGD